MNIQEKGDCILNTQQGNIEELFTVLKGSYEKHVMFF